MPDQGLSAALSGARIWGNASKGYPNTRTGTDTPRPADPRGKRLVAPAENQTSTTLPSTPAGVTRLCGLCRCRLSRYNREDLCAGCSRVNRHQERIVCTVPTDIWQLPDVRQALVNREFGRMCQLIRQHGGIRQDDIAAITGLSQAFLSMLESGARRLTNIDKIIQLLDGLQAPPELTGPMLRPSIHYQPRGSAPTALSRC